MGPPLHGDGCDWCRVPHCRRSQRPRCSTPTKEYRTMKLTFNRAGVEKIVDALRVATKFRLRFQQEEHRPEVWLVGDQGIYLMANIHTEDDAKPFVVYA